LLKLFYSADDDASPFLGGVNHLSGY